MDDDDMVSSPLDFDASDYTEQDDFILGDNSETTPSTSNINVSNINIRENLKTSQKSKNFSELDIDVQVYSSNTLQENYLLKAQEAFENKKKRKRQIEDCLFKTSDEVSKGLITPFEKINTDNNIKKQKNNDNNKNDTNTTSDDEIKNVDVDKLFEDSDSDDDSRSSGFTKTFNVSKGKIMDDGDDKVFYKRINDYKASLYANSDEEEEAEKNKKFKNIGKDLKIDKKIWKQLYNYQRTCLRWLAELHNQNVGGILADEMGLGKTVQICCFLRAVAESKCTDDEYNVVGLGSSIIVCPATLLHQWVIELHKWFPMCRVSIFHSIGSCKQTANELIKKMSKNRCDGSIIITTYATFTQKYKYFSKVNWHYVILDEGHYIRNPDIKAAELLRTINTRHRILISGSPLQNNLKELWSLIDFIYPKRLGDLRTFTEHFSIPIVQGGYSNATPIQIRAAYKCACVLRDIISPFILRRMKKDVEMSLHLPQKNEQVLFCELTPEQHDLYMDYLNSKEMKNIQLGKMEIFKALIMLRKICNHPDFITGGPNRNNEYDTEESIDKEFGYYKRSSKMKVVRQLLYMWKKQNHKVLLFSQSRAMLTILERLAILEDYNYLRMDGGTPIKQRQTLVEKFNTNDNIFLFLLTTKVGGLGVNLTGANRLIIYDPDWNPCTDVQARERAWRIGQNREVTIYRLLTSGTIEEKMYQRQIFKEFLANKVLSDPKQARILKAHHGKELFTLGNVEVSRKYGTETAAIFYGNNGEKRRENFFDKKAKLERKNKKNDKDDIDEEGDETELTSDKIEHLKCLIKEQTVKEDQLHDIKTEEEIEMVSRKENYNIKEENNYGDNDYVLKALFKKDIVQSAISHDIIMKDIPRDHQIIEDEADLIAKRAIEALNASIRQKPITIIQKQNFPIKKEVEKQSNHSDSHGKPPVKSGLDLLSRIQARKDRLLEANDIFIPDNMVNEEYSKHESWPTSVKEQMAKKTKYSSLAEEIKMFFIFNGNISTTQQIVANFKKKVDPEDSYIFRAILKKLAVMNEKTGKWKLKIS
ncbi:DNA excision repair protein ERCC-6 [Strongyloides ratti]|uniref:DNA repair and recombination protein RAD54-like n=1 Tax=Strongyloides ratti TaxID=34506 RepID=A0A090LH03_STRRB|nr:DNA excision repair protein ERCC-6 [Strongyloides ratti]CEF69076.1 DNA excision repair protein ERCC-6 [Strongyloides ratti]